MNLDAQKLQVTGLTNIDAQWNQLVKTIDSLNVVVANHVKLNSSLAGSLYQANKLNAIYKKTIDSLKLIQFTDTIEFIGYNDSQTGSFIKITEKEYNISPKFTWQILKRYPIKIGAATKTKEVTITELKQ